MKGNARVDIGLLLLRLAIGIVFLYVGSQKMFGVLGGTGYVGTVEMFTKQGISPVFAHLAIVAEFFGGLGVLVGFLTPVAAFGIASTMATATYFTVQGMGGFAALIKPGAEVHNVFLPVTLFLIALAILLMGPGKFSLDAKYFRPVGGGKRR